MTKDTYWAAVRWFCWATTWLLYRVMMRFDNWGHAANRRAGRHRLDTGWS